MFNFIKKAGAASALTSSSSSSSTTNVANNGSDDKRKRDKKERKDKQKRERASMSAEELLRLDEVRRSLKIRGKRKEKLPSGITADYTANFLASLNENQPQQTYYAQSDSSETSLNSLLNQRNLLPLPPKPPKRGILKTPKINVVSSNGQDYPDHNALLKNTMQNELITYQNLPQIHHNKFELSVITSASSPSADSLTDTTNSSFATPPFSLSPNGESQGFHKWNRMQQFDDLELPLPPISKLKLPPARQLVIRRQKAPRNDFGFSLRRAMVLERNGERSGDGDGELVMKAVIFAEPGAMVQHNNETGLLPGDKLLEVNGEVVEGRSREEIIERIKASGECVTLKVQPVAELSELSRRSGSDGIEMLLDDDNIRGGTLRRSGSRRFNKTTTAKSEDLLEKEKEWLIAEQVFLMHRNGITLAEKLPSTPTNPTSNNSQPTTKISIRLTPTGEILQVDDDDLEKCNPPQFDHVEDLTTLRHLNESSIMHCLRQRYATNLIHTYAGASTLLIVNPMAPLSIYSEKVVALFKGCKSEDMPPHIYSMAQSAYHTMLQTRRDQSLVFIGRSGSGKTTNFRHSIQYLLTAANSSGKLLTVDKMAAFWMILESFGNCKTLLNQNATKFTQIFSVDFDQSGQIVGGSLQILLLEKSRLISSRSDVNEQTFHIVYQLVYGVEGALRKELHLDQLSAEEATNFLFNNNNQLKHEERQRAQSEFQKLRTNMHLLGINETEQKVLFSVLAVIYHLAVAQSCKTATKWQFLHPQAAQRAAHLLGTTLDELNRCIFEEQTVNGNESIENFAIGLYNELFNLVATLLNRSISSTSLNSSHSVLTTSILLVDCPGFQNAASLGRQNGASFADFCHNYLQERLQLLYHYTNLIMPKERYQQEHLDDVIGAEDDGNGSEGASVLVNLLDRHQQSGDGDKRGILWLLDEESMQTNGNETTASDNGLIDKFFQHWAERDYHYLMRKSLGNANELILQHFQGTNPVLYNVKNWLKFAREKDGKLQAALHLLQESKRDEMAKMFGQVQRMNSYYATSCTNLLDLSSTSTSSLRRVSSIRRTMVNGTGGAKRKSLCLQMKFTIDGLIETLRRTKLRFVYCLLPQHNAGVCEILTNGTAGSAKDGLINMPLLRSQLRGGQILEAVRLCKQGYPSFMPLSEFRRRFRLLAATSEDDSVQTTSPILDERKAVEDMLLGMDLDLSSYRVGLSQIFFRNGILSQLESQRDERLAGMVIQLQAHCRGYLSRKLLKQRKLQDLAVRCIQRNVRKFLLVRDWPWWRLLVRVTPLLNVHRTEEELRRKTEELEAIKIKLDKLETERTTLKHENEKLEAKLSEMTADLADEHSTSTLATERLDTEQSERLRLSREVSELQHKNKELQQTSERLEMELIYARSDLNGTQDDEDDLLDEDDKPNGNLYKQKYERVLRELEFTKRRLQQQHEDDLEQLVGLKKQLEKKLTDAYEEVEEQKQVVGQWKRKVTKLNSEMNDLRLLFEEQTARNNLLEKKQRKFDMELQSLQDELKKEKQLRDRYAREKEMLLAEKYAIESSLSDVRLEYELKDEKLSALQREFDECINGGKTEEEVMLLRRQKIECERRLQDQEEELDELAGQVQLLEQAKLRLEMSLEQMRKEAKKEGQQRDDEMEEIRCNAQKKVKALEQQLENEHEERTMLLREKHELEHRLQLTLENERTDRAGDEAAMNKLKRDLKRTKVLLRDAQMQLERLRTDNPGKQMIRQLKNQLEDVECAKAVALKAKQSLEMEVVEMQANLEEVQKQRNDFEQKVMQMQREKSDLQIQLDENEEEMAEVMKKYKAAVQQMSLDQMALQEQVSLVGELEVERNHLREQLMELSTKLESVESMGDASSNLMVKRSELKVKELESKLELEQTTRGRVDVQVGRLKEAMDKLQMELSLSRSREQQGQEQVRKLQRQLREVKEELSNVMNKEGDWVVKRKEMEKKCEMLEQEAVRARNDLKLALKRIEDLQVAIQGDLENSSNSDGNSDSEQESFSSDESFAVGGGKSIANKKDSASSSYA